MNAKAYLWVVAEQTASNQVWPSLQATAENETKPKKWNKPLTKWRWLQEIKMKCVQNKNQKYAINDTRKVSSLKVSHFHLALHIKNFKRVASVNRGLANFQWLLFRLNKAKLNFHIVVHLKKHRASQNFYIPHPLCKILQLDYPSHKSWQLTSCS